MNDHSPSPLPPLPFFLTSSTTTTPPAHSTSSSASSNPFRLLLDVFTPATIDPAPLLMKDLRYCWEEDLMIADDELTGIELPMSLTEEEVFNWGLEQPPHVSSTMMISSPSPPSQTKASYFSAAGFMKNFKSAPAIDFVQKDLDASNDDVMLLSVVGGKSFTNLPRSVPIPIPGKNQSSGKRITRKIR